MYVIADLLDTMELTAKLPFVKMLAFTDSALVQTLAIATVPVTMELLVLILFAFPDAPMEELAYLQTTAVALPDGTEPIVPVQSV